MPTTPFDCTAMVQARVQRSCQSPFYSHFREEVTRQASSVYEVKAKSASCEPSTPGIVDTPEHFFFFPFQNDRSSRESYHASQHRVPDCVTLIGGTGFFGKFVAEQYLNRGISVTVLARDVEKARSIFVPIASGERDERAMASKGYVRMPGHTAVEPVRDAGEEGETESRKVLVYRYKSALSAPSSTHASAATTSTDSATPFSVPTPQSVPHQREVSLEIVHGDVNCRTDVEFAVRRSSIVYYLVPAVEEDSKADEKPHNWYKIQSYLRWPGSSFISSSLSSAGSVSYGGFLSAFDACRRVDAHFVSLTPLWVHGSRMSPMFWYRRMVSHPWGYVKAVRNQELNLLESTGIPSPRCSFGTELDGDTLERPPAWRYWWSILRSTKLPDDLESTPRSPVRFSLFRLSDVVYPAFNTHMAAVKNNRVDTALHVHNIDVGDLDARLLAGVLAKTLALCSSVVESRIDIGGRLHRNVDMRDTAAVLDLFCRFRNEE